MTAIVLAGGFGTRLKSVLNNVPKPMADINGKPFLLYLFEILHKYNITTVILSVGYKQEIIKNYFNDKYKNISILYSCEDTPLGTGGAIKKALELVEIDKNVLVINGDTFFDINFETFFNSNKNYNLSLCIKPMKNFDRYGSVKIKENKIISFLEKKPIKEGYINTGIYCINKNIFKNIKEKIFSFETFLEKQKDIYCYIDDGYFIDIGIPEDYEKAKIDFRRLF